MPVIKLVISAVNYPSFLRITARRAVSPAIIEAVNVYGPADLNQPINVLLPSVGEIPAAAYIVMMHESSDGIVEGQELGKFEVDARQEIPVLEVREYITGRGHIGDPTDGGVDIVDSYLDGKTVAKVDMEGLGRGLVNPPSASAEYSLINGGGIHLGLSKGKQLFFSNGEITLLTLTYIQKQDAPSSSGGLFTGMAIITADTTLDATHRNKKLDCRSAVSKLAITLEALAATPEGTSYTFVSNRGVQNQVRVLAQGSDKILCGRERTEISFARGESLRISKNDGYWEVDIVPEGTYTVGQRVNNTMNLPLALDWKGNLIPEDGRLVHGDDFPRLFEYVRTQLGAGSVISVSTATLIGSGYVHPPGQEGKFVISNSDSERRFRVPNSQGKTITGGDDFDTDTPGLFLEGQVGVHEHQGIEVDTTHHGAASGGISGAFEALVNNSDPQKGHGTINGSKTGPNRTGLNALDPRNTVDRIIEIWYRKA